MRLLLGGVEVDIAVDIHLLDLLQLITNLVDLLRLLGTKTSGNMPVELLNEQRNTLGASELVTNRVLNGNLLKDGAVVEGDLDGVSDGTLVGIVVLGAVGLVLDTLHLGTELIDPGVGGDGIVVIGGSETAVDQGNSNHVLDAVIAIGVVVEGALLIDDANGGLLGADADGLDIVGGLAGLLEDAVKGHGSLTSSLRMELGGERDLEEHVLHDVGAVGALELEGLSLEEDIVEAPDLGGKNGGDTADATVLHHQGEVHGARARITSGPRLAGHGVGGMAVGAERLAIDPGLGDGIGGLLAGEAEEL